MVPERAGWARMTTVNSETHVSLPSRSSHLSRLGSAPSLGMADPCPSFAVFRVPRRPAATCRLWRVVLLGVLAVMGASCAPSPEVRKQKALERGEKYLIEGKPNEAIIELQNALQVDPKFAPALHALGRAYERKSWFFDAERELTRAQKLRPDSVPVAVDLGKVLIELGAWDEAEEQVKLILTQEPDNPQALTIRGGVLRGQGKLNEAFALLKTTPPGRISEVDRIRADILLSAGKFDEAEAAYRVAQATKPDDLKTLLGLGAISLERRKLDEAKEFFQQAKASNPYDPRPPTGLASILAQQGNLPDAIKELEGIDPRAWTGGAVLALGQYYLQANRAADAVRLLGPLVRGKPKLAQARYLLATALSLSGDASAAVGEFEELDRQLPNALLVRLRLAALYTQQGRPREALERLDPVSKQSEKVPAYHLERGRALIFLGHLDDAFAAASTARRLAPQMPEPYTLMGLVRAQQGNPRGAEELFTKAAEVDPTFVPAYLALGQLHFAAKDVQTALKDFDAAVKADPNSLGATRAKATALVRQHRLKDAIGFVEDAVKGGTRDPGFYSLLGNLYLADGQKHKAAASFRRALEADPRNSAARLGLARMALAAGKDEDGITQLQAAVKERPDDLIAVLLLRSLHERLGRPQQAIPVLEAAVRADPRKLTFSLALCEVYANVGRFDDALGCTSEVLARQPDLPVVRLVRGRSYLGKGDAGAALKDIQDALRSNPKFALAHFYLARVYVLLGRKEQAQAEYREVIRLAPAFALAKRELAAVRGERQDEQSQQEEINRLREVIKTDPKNVAGRESLAHAYFERGQMKEAEAELTQLLTLAPSLAEPNLLMARILFSQNKEEEAVSYLRAALRSNPSHIASNILLGHYLASKGRREQAIRPLENALSVNPNLPEVRRLLANLYAQSGRFPEALALAQQLQRADPKAAGPWVLIGALEVEQKNPRAAIDAFEKSLKIDANSAQAYRGLGQAHSLLGQNDQAEESYRRALKLDENDAVSLNNLAWILVEIRKKPDEALALAVKAERLAPQSASVFDTLGWIHYRRQAYSEAERLLTQAAERSRFSGLVQFHLGMTYAKLGRKTDAIGALRRAAKLDPKLAEREKIDQLIKELES